MTSSNSRGCPGCDADIGEYHRPGCTGRAPEAMPENPKAIYGRAKPSLALFPAAAMVPVCEVFELGAAKYGPFNWRKDPVEAMTYANAALRHIFSWIDGANQDHESGLSDLAHAICCMAIVLDASANGKLIDDRPHKGVAQELIEARTKSVAQ